MSKSFTSSTEAVRFSRRWWGETVRIAFWVSIVTVLIWVYADMEFTQTEQVRMTVRLTVGKSTKMELVSPSDNPVVFTLGGSGTSLKRFVDKYDRTVRTFDLSKSYRPGVNQAVTTAEVLAGFDELRELGLAVLSAEPKAITGVHIDTVEIHDVPVEFRYTGAQLVKEPAADVLVRVASTRWKTILEKTGPKERRIRTAVKDFKHLGPGDKRTVTFELLSSIAGVPVRLLDTAEIAADIEVRRLTASKKIAISVCVVVPVSWTENGVWKEYQLKRKDPLQWRRDITVVGPREHIDKLKPVDVDAYIVLVEDDKQPVSWSTRKVVLRFPPDLQIALADGQDEPTVQFRLEKRTVATPP